MGILTNESFQNVSGDNIQPMKNIGLCKKFLPGMMVLYSAPIDMARIIGSIVVR